MNVFLTNTKRRALISTGSVADVFMANSYDSFVLDTTIVPWALISRTENQTADGVMGMNGWGSLVSWWEVMNEAKKNGFPYHEYDEDNDGKFDCIVIMHSGAAAENGGNDCETGVPYTERIWSHATSGAFFSTNGIGVGRFYIASGIWDTCPTGANGSWEIARIAVIAHECGHFLGLPDLYDRDGGGAGAGSFDLQGTCTAAVDIDP